jgi:predicted secreted protein
LPEQRSHTMKRVLVMIMVLGVLLALISSSSLPVAASGFSAVASSTAPPLLSHSQQYSVDESSDGQTILMNVNDELMVTLQSNHSTGFVWLLDQISDTSVLQKISDVYIPSSHLGGMGSEVWTFKAIKNGTSTIFMEYSQPWDGGTKEARTFDLNVNVTPIPASASSNLSVLFVICSFTVLIVLFISRRRRSSLHS